MKYRIIILEDKYSNLENLKFELNKRGYEVVNYEDSMNGLIQYDDEEYSTDFIITNITEPFINGIKFVEKIRKKDIRLKNIAILAGNFSDEDIEKAISLGCRVFLQPLSIVSLLDWLEEKKKNVPPKRKLKKL